MGLSQERKMAPFGAISVSSSVFVMALLDDHHLVGVLMAPASVQAEVSMLAELGARAQSMMLAALDHDGLGAFNRRRRDGAATAIAPSAAKTYPSFFILSSSIE